MEASMTFSQIYDRLDNSQLQGAGVYVDEILVGTVVPMEGQQMYSFKVKR